MKEYRININGTTYNVSVEEVGASKTSPMHKAEVVTPVKEEKTIPQSETLAPKEEKKPAQAAVVSPGGEDYVITSPLPGIAFDILVREGEHVKAGQKIFVIEAMKMENDIESDRDGIVKKIAVTKGDSVYEGDTLLVLSV